MRTIKDIDKDNNRYVTNQELDDILKMYYPELRHKQLIKLFDRFQDPIQPVLVDYKKFKKAVDDEILVNAQFP